MKKNIESQASSDYENILLKSGCKDMNDKVLLCYDKHKDWRLCSSVLLEFKQCIEKNKNSNFIAHENTGHV